MEGPSLVILREELDPFVGQRVLQVSGNTQQPKKRLRNCTLTRIDTWAKVLFLTFTPRARSGTSIVTKTHFLMLGSYRINEPKEGRTPRLELRFKTGTVYFYACSIRFDAQEALAVIDPRIDLMSPQWSEHEVLKQMARRSESLLCDLFLDQEVFAGSGNIVKNEVLFNLRTHPLTPLSAYSKTEWPKIARAVRTYCFQFYEWKKRYELMRHWQVYRQHYCPLCQSKLTKASLGKWERRTFFCPRCQKKRRRVTDFHVFDVLPLRLSPSKASHQRFDH